MNQLDSTLQCKYALCVYVVFFTCFEHLLKKICAGKYIDVY